MLASATMAVTPSTGATAVPDAALVGALADRCVQCGLCLPHCPTYQLDRQEAESPRGRIAVWKALATGAVQPDAATLAHLDHCLGCRACEAACPAGVEYGRLLPPARAVQRRQARPPLRQRLLEWLAARPARMDRVLALYRLAWPALPGRLRLLPRPPAAHRPPDPAPPGTATVTIFRGCVARRYDADTHAALQRLLAAAGIQARFDDRARCCGALHAHAGDPTTAHSLAAHNRAALADAPVVLCAASGCQPTLAASLEGDAPDPYAFLLRHVERLAFRPASARIALHRPCTQQRIPGSTAALRALLDRIPGLDCVDLPDACCGAAGTQLATDPGRARALSRPLLDAFEASGATTLVSANIGCRLHLHRGGVAAEHPLVFLERHLSCPSPDATASSTAS